MEVEEGRNYVRVCPGYEIHEHEIAISCPNALTFSFASCGHKDAKGYLSRVDRAGLPQNIAIRLALMEHYLLGEESFWWPYISILPQPFERSAASDAPVENAVCPKPRQSFHTPLYFDKEDMLWLNGTNLGSAVMQRASSWKEEFEMVKDALKGLEESERALWTRLAPYGRSYFASEFDV